MNSPILGFAYVLFLGGELVLRLINGDCLKEMDVLIAEGVKIDAVIVDLPYGTTCNKKDGTHWIPVL